MISLIMPIIFFLSPFVLSNPTYAIIPKLHEKNLEEIIKNSPSENQHINLGASPIDIGVNEDTNTIYVTNYDDDTISVINGQNDTKIGDVKVGSKSHRYSC
jgi:YVTN family beta-propeller protein